MVRGGERRDKGRREGVRQHNANINITIAAEMTTHVTNVIYICDRHNLVPCQNGTETRDVPLGSIESQNTHAVEWLQTQLE